MPSKKLKTPAPQARTLVVDNGGYTIKAGYVTPDGISEPTLIPNCIARDRNRKTYIASDLSKCNDFGEIAFRRPVDKGYVVSWETQREIWGHEFFEKKTAKEELLCDPAETRLVLAEQPNTLPALQMNCDQMVFEEFGFASYYRGVGPAFNVYHDIQAILGSPSLQEQTPQTLAEIFLLVDSGYSGTSVTPVFHGRSLQSAIRRLDIGGKFMTNYLTRLLSLRHYDMRNDTYIVNEMKEQVCYVSTDFKADLEKCWKGTRGDKRAVFASGSDGIAKDYVLPDFQTRSKGIVRNYDPTLASTKARQLAAAATNEDILTLRNERFSVPELLFTPSDVGLQQPGVADLIWQSINSLPMGLWPALLANIVVVGGNTCLGGFVERLRQEITLLVPDDLTVRVAVPADPITSTWSGAAKFAQHKNVDKLAVTKQEYEENGQAWLTRKFAAGLSI